MKIMAGFIFGVFITLTVIFLSPTKESAQRDMAIIVHIHNDTKNEFNIVKLQIDSKQNFTCTLRHKKCSFIITDTGDIGFKYSAKDKAGIVWVTDNQFYYYAEPGTTHTLNLSNLTKEHITSQSRSRIKNMRLDRQNAAATYL